MAKSVTIKNKDNLILYPKTVSSLVYNNTTGNTVAEELDNKLESSDIKTVNGISLIGSGNVSIVGEKGDKGDPLTYADLTAAQKTELARDATAAAQQAANSLSYIENAISNLDPSLSTEQAIVALTALLSVIESNVNTLTEKTDELYANRILDSDKIIKNQPLLNLYLSSDEYEVFSGGYVGYSDGQIVSNETQGYIKISNFRGNSLRIEGIKNTLGYAIGYGFFDSSDNRLSGNYYGPSNNNYNLNLTINANAAYVLISIGEIASFDFSKMIWKIGFLPEPIYDHLKSLNGVLIKADSINGVATKEMEWLRNGIITKLNKLDINLVIPGYKIDKTSQTIAKDVNGVLYLLEIDNNVSKICIYGLKGTGDYIYHSTYILDEDFNVLLAKNEYGRNPKWQEHNITSLTNPKFICFNAKGAEVANNLEDVIILYNPPYDYTLDLNYYLQHSNDLKFNFHNCVDSLPINYFADPQYATRNSLADTIYLLNIPTLGGEYVTYYFPDGDYVTTADSFVLYDENDTVISSEVLNNVSTINFGYVRDKKHYFQCRLNNSCKKLYMRISFIPELIRIAHREMVERGNVVYVSKTRQMWWTGPKIINIDGYSLPVTSSDPLEGKIICCFGDSITSFGSNSTSGGYPWLIQKKHNCTVINYAKGNAHFTDVPNTDPTANTNPLGPDIYQGYSVYDSNGYNNTVSTQVRWCIRELAEDGVVPDVVILSGCTNDGFSSKPIGDLDTALALYPMTTDAVHTDFYSLAVYLVSKIRLAFPKAKIFFGTPIRSLNATLMIKLKLYVEAFHNVAKALGIEVIDWHDESGIIEYPSSYDNNIWFNDDLHPSQLGVEAMAQLAVSKIATSLMQPR